MNYLPRLQLPKSCSSPESRASFHAGEEGRSNDRNPNCPNWPLEPVLEILLPCFCAAAAGGVCLVGAKAEVWSACPHLPRSNRMLGALSQAVCEEAGMPLLILLNGAGAALFEPHKRPQRILPMSAYDRFGPNCSFGLIPEQVANLLKAKPKPSETLEAFVRRVISGAHSPNS